MIDYLYASVGIVVAAGYLPQVWVLLRATTPCRDISIPAWLIWEYTVIVSLLYSIYGQEVLDVKFVAVNAINTFFVSLIILITLYKRRKYIQISAEVEGIEQNLPDVSDFSDKISAYLDKKK